MWVGSVEMLRGIFSRVLYSWLGGTPSLAVKLEACLCDFALSAYQCRSFRPSFSVDICSKWRTYEYGSVFFSFFLTGDVV